MDEIEFLLNKNTVILLQMKYGGHGFSHILQTIVPMMKTRNVSQEDIEKILIHNPRTWLTFK